MDVAKNIKLCREANGFTQQNIADFLNIERSTYSNYELGTREIPFEYLEKLADLFGCNLEDLLQEDESAVKNMLVSAFRVTSLDKLDLKAIAQFKDIVKNYLKISKLLSNE